MVNLLCLEKVSEEKSLKPLLLSGGKHQLMLTGVHLIVRLNTFNNHVHEKIFGYNPYELELSQMIRKGLLDRKTALEKVEKKIPVVLQKIAKDLDLPENAF
jgi:hypothetical protein